ncbi:MAG: hypothetical protein F6K26_10170 [Moorea sp. SIO2I5]|nr:hypothetical protein [Moorena sp. SIO2I5]
MFHLVVSVRIAGPVTHHQRARCSLFPIPCSLPQEVQRLNPTLPKLIQLIPLSISEKHHNTSTLIGTIKIRFIVYNKARTFDNRSNPQNP